MKKILLIVATMLSALINSTLNAQETDFGVTAGVNINAPDGDDTRVGFQAGIKMEYGFRSLDKGWFAETALKLSYIPYGSDGKFESVGGIDGYGYLSHYNPYYLNIPVMAGYRFGIARDLSLSVSAGVYGNIGLFGKAKYTAGSEQSSNNVFGSDRGDFKRFNWGIAGKIGLEFKRQYQLSVSYNHGLSDPAKDLGGQSRERNIAVAVSYIF